MPQLPQLQPGDFGVLATHGPLLDRLCADLIQDVTDAPVNHAVLYLGDGQLIEAARRVRITPVTAYPHILWSSAGFLLRAGPSPPGVPRAPRAVQTLTPQQRALITSYARAQLGAPYNLLDFLAIGLAQRRLGHLIGLRSALARRLSSGRSFICSQLVDAAYTAAGIHLFHDGRPSGMVSPADLYHLLPAATRNGDSPGDRYLP